MLTTLRRSLFVIAAVAALVASGVRADQIGSATLNIGGRGLTIDREAFTGVDIPGVVQTQLGGLTDDAAQPGDLQALAELTGPGLDAPIPLRTQPGRKFTLPPLHEKGDYLLQNVRLADKDGNFLAPAVPPTSVMHVTGTLEPSVEIRQLSADDLRARGINIDLRNYDVYDFTYSFAINGQTVTVPYPVVIDKRTHEVVPAPATPPFTLPIKQPDMPPRWDPPYIGYFPMDGGGEDGFDAGGSGPLDKTRGKHLTIPAALVIPNGFGVLHQFFAVILNVSNAAPVGSKIVIDGITATISVPTALRIVKVNPPVTIGQPVPVRMPDGSTIVIAGAMVSADWSLEALRSGTHTVSLDIRATYKQEGQDDVALHGKVSTALVVSDPRFQINFVHPDTVRKNEPYTAYAFITNVSPQKQNVKLDRSAIPLCSTGSFNNHICRTTGEDSLDLAFDAGQTISVPYKLTPDITGHVYAGIPDTPNAIEGTVTLVMGVSEEGVPLSPATLVMPYHTQFVSQALVDGYMPLLGLGYSLAVAPVTPKTAALPHLIRTDVWTRAQNIARAGERIFVTRQTLATDNPDEDREPLFNLALDLLGNVDQVAQLASSPDMHEWDQLRMLAGDGLKAGAALGDELTRVGLANGRTMTQFASDFAAATSHRSPYLFALVHGAAGSGPYALSVNGSTTTMSGTADNAAAVRKLPFGDLMKIDSAAETGQLALVGRWSEGLTLTIVPASTSFTVDLIYPDTADGSMLKASFNVTVPVAGAPVTLKVDRGNRNLIVNGGTGIPQPDAVAQTPLSLVHAAQDLFLDPAGHIVTLLFNRPVTVAGGTALRDNFELRTTIAAINRTFVRKNDPADPTTFYIPGAALQDDGRLLNISFDHSLSNNAQYLINAGPMTDARSGTLLSSSSVVPRIDNARRGGIVVGKLLTGQGSGIPKTVVSLDGSNIFQYDTTDANGEFFYEFIPRDLDLGLSGEYHLQAEVAGRKAMLDGIIRTPGEVQNVILQFLGRGTAQGRVTFSDGTPVPKAPVVVASAFSGDLQNEFHGVNADANGNYSISDLPVGPLTFTAYDAKGNVTYASGELRVPGDVITQNLVIQKHDIAGFGVMHVTIRRSDQKDAAGNFLPVSGAHVGVWQAGYGLSDGFTDSNGQITFSKVPAGSVQILAADFTITRETISFPLPIDLKPDQVVNETLVLHVPTADELATGMATIAGHVQRDDPTSPGNPVYYVKVPGAKINIEGMASVTADADGAFVYPNVPLAKGGKDVNFYDPATGRSGTAKVPSPLTAGGSDTLELVFNTAQPQGYATFRVHLTSIAGQPVDGYQVFWPGYPKVMFQPRGNGNYELVLPVPQGLDAWAVPAGSVDPVYGDQTAHGSMHAEFNGQLVVTELRLPGQGTVKARVRQFRRCDPNDPQCVAGFNVVHGKVSIAYEKWDDAEQELTLQDRIPPIETVDADEGYGTFGKVPVGSATVETIDLLDGYATKEVFIKYEGDIQSVDLDMAAQLSVSGRVLNYDLQTPMGNATVYLHGGLGEYVTHTKPDGSFIFDSVAPGQSFRIEADGMIDGIHRRGFLDGSTPKANPISGLIVIMREQGNVSGIVVDGSGAPVPLARYWARELAWPYTTFGSNEQPLFTGQDGKFAINNVFSGGVRITAELPNDDSVRGDAQATIKYEGDNQTNVRIALDPGGVAPLKVVVIDSLDASARVPNAEVTLLLNGSAFDFGNSDANGEITFADVPVSAPGFGTLTYSVTARSKALGRAGRTDGIHLSANVPQTATVALNLTGRMSGTLTDADIDPPAPVKGTAVHVMALGFEDITSTGSVGDFLFNGIPEGNYRMQAVDDASGRTAKIDDLQITKLVPAIDNIPLVLEKTGSATINVYLPDDHGQSSGIFAPLADIKVWGASLNRETQAIGQPVTFQKFITRYLYFVEAAEVGGDHRTIRVQFGFAPGSLTTSVNIVFPTTGTVRVEAKDGNGNPVAGASVAIGSTGGGGGHVFTDADGTKTVSNVGLGDIFVTASANGFIASASAKLDSHSVTLVIPVTLSGSRVSLSGHVTAEVGGPSAGTRLIVDVSQTSSFGPVHIDTVTDANGDYHFDGIPAANNTATLHFYGPDGVTVGATVVVPLPAGPLVNDVTLDGTPPQVTAIDPANNANSVAPNAHIFVTFSEPLKSIAAGNFQLIAGDDGSTVPISVRNTTSAKGEYQAEITPGSQLKSNTTYVFKINRGLQDPTGNSMTADIITSFRTVDYTEPKIIHVLPPLTQPIDEGVLFQFQFNKSVTLDSFANGGFATMEVLSGPGGTGTGITLSVPRFGQTTSGADDPTTLVFGPVGTTIDKGKFYRLTVGGIRDTAVPFNTQKEPQSFEYHSVDDIKPVVTIKSPVAPGLPLVVNTDYVIGVTITDEGTTNPSSDIQWVDWFSSDGTTDTVLVRSGKAPYTYTLHVVPGMTKVILRAQATDLSENRSDLTNPASSFTWDVIANQPPQNVVLTPSATNAYRKNHLSATVTFSDEGLRGTVHLTALAKHADLTDYPLPDSAITPQPIQNVVRASTDLPWPVTTYGIDIPGDVAEGQPIVLTATVTDSDVQTSAPATATINVLTDSVAPTLTITNPKAETNYTYVAGGANTFPITVKAQDGESGVARIQISYDGHSDPDLTNATYDAATKTWTFNGTGTITRKTTDTRVHVTATAVDYHGNATPATVDVIFKGVTNSSAADVQWLTPLDGAALKAGDVVAHLKLRVHVVDKGGLVSVAFTSPAFTAQPAALPNAGVDAIYQQIIDNFTVPSAPFTITVKANDAVEANNVELPITIDPVVFDSAAGDKEILVDKSVEESEIAGYTGKSVLVRGATTLYFKKPVVLKNLIVLEGAKVSDAAETKLDVTVTDHLYVDGDSSIDVSAKGYLGGWQLSDDHLTTNGESGKTIPGNAGASGGANASYGGVGGDAGGAPNATYGSIVNPTDFGSGGSGGSSSSNPGGHGGGAVVLHGGSTATDLGRIVVAGNIRADGESATGSMKGAGSGGSVNVTARALATGPSTRITANGGDDDARNNGASGAGGGRVAVTATERLDLYNAATELQARGGRNLAGDGASQLDGGAGTVYLVRPAATAGELRVSALDERFPSTTHLTRSTPIAAANGPLAFDTLTASSRALVRLDDAVTLTNPQSVDATSVVLAPADLPVLTMTTAPASGATVVQGTTISTTVEATSPAGINEIDFVFSAGSAAPLTFATWPAHATNSGSPATIVVPAAATPGPATLKAVTTDRSGRTTETTVANFDIAANTAPVITAFDITPAPPVYVGTTLSVALTATDDVAVKTLSLTSQIGSGTPSTQTFTTNVPSAGHTFAVPIAKDATLDGATVTLTAKADDGTAAPASQVKSVTIAHDGNAPVVAISQPIAGTNFTVDVNSSIPVVATATDAETGVKSINVVIEGGSITPTVMTPTANPNEYAANLPVPTVPGSVPVNRTITVTATDTVGNPKSATVAVQITPHYDPTAPIVTFTCGSDGAIVAAGAQIPLSVTAVPGSTGTAVSAVSFSDGATTLPATANGSVYSATYTVPSTAAPGSVITILASATTNGQGTGTQQVQLTVATFDRTISADTTVASSDTSYDGKDVLITAGKATFVGPHTFKKLVVLGGSFVPKNVDFTHADTITVDTIYVACGASVDASSYVGGPFLGFAKNTTLPGAGTPADSSGGGHIGRGGSWLNFITGGTFGSVVHPLEPGGGGEVGDPAYDGGAGGGTVRLIGTSVIVDGALRANAEESSTWGLGAGGSVYITAGTISGGGLVQAIGGTWSGATNIRGGGGGGAIAIEYGSASGTLLSTLSAIGGNATQQGAAGTVFIKGPQSVYGDLLISNAGRSGSLGVNVITDLPAFGTATVLSTPTAGTAVVDAMWEGSYSVGNLLRVFAPDGSVRGTWAITAIANDASVRTINGALTVPTQGIAYSGYLMYSNAGYGGAHVLAVRNNSGTWQYDTGSAFTNFTPQTGDVLFASFTKSASAITTMQTTTCPAAACAPLSGLPAAALVRGEVVMNATAGTNPTFVVDWVNAANNKFFIHPDSDRHGIVLSSGPVTVTLATGADVRTGDSVRGVYKFDNVTVKNARAYTPDLVESSNAPSVDANSTWIPGNLAAPVIDPSKISVGPGANGPVVIGTAGAALDVGTDAVVPVELYIRNSARSLQAPAFPTNSDVTFGTKGGFSAQKVPNGVTWAGLAVSAASSSTYAYVEGRPSQTNLQMDILLTATPSGAAEYDWGIFNNGTCQVWVNNSPVTGTFPYTTNTLFRVERTPANVYFYLDGQLKYTAIVDSRPRYAEVAFKEDGAEWNSIDYGFDTPARFSGVAAANGSFTVPVYGAAGDALTITARDRHTYPLVSVPVAIGSIPAGTTISAPLLSPNPVTGGHAATGTVTLGTAAAAGGATVYLGSSSAVATVPATVTIPAGATSANFNITTQVVTAPATATITATYGNASYSTILNVVVDNVPPSISITAPAAGTHFLEGSGQITVQAAVTDADSGVQSVTASIDGTSFAMTAPSGSNVYSKTFAAPFIDGTASLPKDLTVTALDRSGNPNTSTLSIVIDPVTDTTPPATSFGCSAPTATLPAGYGATLMAVAIPPSSSNVVQRVEFRLGDGTVIAASSAGNNVWTAPWSTPSAGTTTPITVTATAAGGGSSSASQQVTLIATDTNIKTTSAITAADTSLDGKIVAVGGGATVTIDGQHNFAKLLVIEGAKIVQSRATTLSIGAAGSPADVYIACNSSIDLTGDGYAAGLTYPLETAAGFPSGGSHFGHGGWSGSCACGTIYGNVYHPNEAGGGGENNANGQAGGGNVHIIGGSVVVDGSINATGGSGGRGGAGGSVWITTGSISGAGSIDASGGSSMPSGVGAGGGGGIAVEYTDAASVLPVLRATGGSAPPGTLPAGAGTIVVKGTNSLYGDLTVDNGGASAGTTELPSLGFGVAQSGSGGSTLVTDRAANVPAYFFGTWVEIRDVNNNVRGVWRINGIDATNGKKVTLAPNGSESITIAAGDTWRGVYRFDNVKLNGVTLATADRLDSNPPQKLNGATIVGNNQGAPLLDMTKISIGQGLVGPVLVGQANAVTDPDLPITVFALNGRTNLATNVTAASNGSFSINLSGTAGDSIYVFARDTQVYPLTSPQRLVGQLTSGGVQTSPTTFTSTMTGGDGNFHARRVAMDVNNVIAFGATTNKLLLFDTSTGSLVYTRTMISGSNTNDVVVRDGVAYVSNANFTFEAWDLTASPPVKATAGTDCGNALSVAVSGGYAFVGDNCGDGRINIFDISNPKVPVRLRSQSTLSGVNYTQLIPYGNYLIAISNSAAHDVVVLDRRDINNLVRVGDFDIPSFSANRASLVGTTLYVGGNEGSLALIDLTTPSSPVTIGTRSVATTTHAVQAVATLAYVAADVAGIGVVDAFTPSSPQLTGSIATSPQIAWDVLVRGQLGIAAADDRLLTFAAPVPPQVDATKISMSTDGHTVTITGTAAAVLGALPLTLTVHDETNAAVPDRTGASVANNGSFSTTIAAAGGDVLDIVATDGNGNRSVVTVIGAVPFGSGTTLLALPASLTGDGSFRARRIGLDATWMAVVNYPANGLESNRMALFDMSSGSPVYSRTVTLGSVARDVAVRNNVVYVGNANFGFEAWDMTVNPPTKTTASLDCGQGFSVAVDGTYAYAGDNCGDGRVNIFDLTNPKAPVKLRAQGTLGGGFTYTSIIPYGNYLICTSPNLNGGAGHDVVVLDKHDINNLVKVADLDIPNFTGFRGSIAGTTLYLGSTDGKMAVVDLTNPAAPVWKNNPITVTAGSAYGANGAGTEAIVADGSVGVTFYDVSLPATPKLIGTQNVGGTSWDVKLWNGTAYIANEMGVVALSTLVAPPTVNAGAITIAQNAGGATVTGGAGAAGGSGTLTVKIHDRTNTNVADATGTAQPNGSFVINIGAASGDVLDATVTDASGRSSVATLIGSVPFGAGITMSATSTVTDTSFRARRISVDGNWLAAVSYPTGNSYESNKLVLWDVSSGTPVYNRTLTLASNSRDVVVRNNVAYVSNANFALEAWDLTASPPTRNTAGLDCGSGFSLAVDGSYAFVGDSCNDGRINIFDLTNPKVPVKLRSQSTLSSGSYMQLIPYGNYLVGICGSAHDVVVLDRRDINGLVKVADIDIAGFSGFRGSIVGSTLYVGSSDGKLLVVDLTNPAAPLWKNNPLTVTAGSANSVTVSGSEAIVGDGSAGVSFYDVSLPATPKLIGTQNVGGTSFESRLSHGNLYIAAEEGVITMAGPLVPPAVNTYWITVTHTAGGASVAGAAGAISGTGSLSLTVHDESNASVADATGVLIGSNGSFSTTIAAAPGDVLDVVARDGSGRASATIVAGSVPFGVATLVATPASLADGGFHSRRLATDGTYLVVQTYPAQGWDSSRMIVFSLASGTPVYTQTIALSSAARDVIVRNGVAYVGDANFGFEAWDLSANPATHSNAGLDCSSAWSVTVDGNFGFAGDGCSDGRINIFDITNPKVPVKVRAQATLGCCFSYTQLIPYGNYLVAMTPNVSGTTGHDVVVIDKSNINSLVKVADIDVTGINLFRGKIVGSTLYATGDTGVVLVDLTTPASPALISRITTPGVPRGLDVDTANHRLFVSDGTTGETVIDITTPSTPKIVGTQGLFGDAWDTFLVGSKLYVAAEEMIFSIDLTTPVGPGMVAPPAVSVPAAAPALPALKADRALMTIELAGMSAIVRGGRGAVTGTEPLTVSITNSTLGVSVPVVAVAADGSFEAKLSAAAGDHLVLRATSGSGETLEVDLGEVTSPTP